MVTVLTLRWGSRLKRRVPRVSSTGGAKPDREVRTSPATACLDSFRSAIWARMDSSRARASSMPTGSSAIMPDTLLLKVPSPVAGPAFSGVRTETGTSVRTTRSTDSLRLINRSRKPRVMAVSTTSLTVPPRPRRTTLIWSRLLRAQAQRRWGPMGPLRLDNGVKRTTLMADLTPCATSRT